MSFYKFFENPKVYNFITTVFSFNNKRLRRYLPELIKVNKDTHLLDVGCGTGKYAIFSCRYIGIDPNKDYIDYAKKHHQGTFLEMDGTDLKFSDNTFDFVINISILHHVSDETTIKMIDEMRRACKKDGYIYVIDAVYPKNLLGYLLFRFDRGHYRRTFEELKNLLLNYDFRVITDDVGKTFPYQWAVFSYKK